MHRVLRKKYKEAQPQICRREDVGLDYPVHFHVLCAGQGKPENCQQLQDSAIAQKHPLERNRANAYSFLPAANQWLRRVLECTSMKVQHS